MKAFWTNIMTRTDTIIMPAYCRGNNGIMTRADNIGLGRTTANKPAIAANALTATNAEGVRLAKAIPRHAPANIMGRNWPPFHPLTSRILVNKKRVMAIRNRLQKPNRKAEL